MKAIKTLFTSLSARFDCMVSELENHEALAESSIKEFERTDGQAKYHHLAMEGESARLGREGRRLEEEMAVWKDRARRVHASDQDKPLACVQRLKQAERQLAAVRGRLNESEQ